MTAGSFPTKGVNRNAPQDRKPSGREMMESALRMQSANMAQKATLDVMGGKLILILAALKKAGGRNPDRTVAEISAITSMTRGDIAERRSSGTFVYPDPEIQAVLNKAADEILQLLLPQGNDE